MMVHAKKQLPNAVALLLGFSIAIVFAPIVLATADWYRQWSAEHNPPATLQWNSVERIDTDTLRLTMRITRHRDCDFVRILGYTGATLQSMQPAESLSGRYFRHQPALDSAWHLRRQGRRERLLRLRRGGDQGAAASGRRAGD